MIRTISSRWVKACVCAVFLSCIFVIYSSGMLSLLLLMDKGRGRRLSLTDLTAANATLGFQKIIAISTGKSWRTRGLFAAASLTGLQIEIPPQPINSPFFVENFEKAALGSSHTGLHGSARAWLAHLDIIKHVIASDLETALIIEDDVDWDIEIRGQTELLAESVRIFTNATALDQSPYGTQWDMIWLGHCGEHIDAKSNDKIVYLDSTRVSPFEYSGWSALWLPYLNPQSRELQRGIQPVCTFAYAVTRQGAQNILQYASTGPSEAFDVAIANKCVSRTLRCLIVNPELMHHYIPPKGSGYISEVEERDRSWKSADELTFEKNKGCTPNIANSARCKALFDQSCLATPSYRPQPNFPELAPFEEQWKSINAAR